MNRIDQKFADLKALNKTAFIPFLTIGDPNLELSIKIIEQLEMAGADIIELGVPYSDPLADGPVIQRASERALKHTLTIKDCIYAAKKARQLGVETPFILFTYYNPVLQLGLEHFFDLLIENDISGLIIPDLPIEEDSGVRALSIQHRIHLIPLVAPTSNDRIAEITSHAAGFVYCVSSLGVTGERAQFHDNIEQFITSVKKTTELPVAVGFGVSNNEQFKQFSTLCDGVIVGSAIVRQIEEALPLLLEERSKEKGLLQIRDFVRKLIG